MTKLEYHKSTYLFELESELIGLGESEMGRYAIFDKTIFYPRGGGQESDVGKVTLLNTNDEINIKSVRFHQGKVYHYGNFSSDIELNQRAKLKVDSLTRIVNSKLHTSGHLIASIIETNFENLRAIKGYHFPVGSYVEFKILDDFEYVEHELISELNEFINRDVKNELLIYSDEKTLDEIKESCKYVPEYLPKDKPLRVVTIEGYFPIPCGGTHIKSTSELNNLRVYKIKKKKGNIKISYKLE